MIKIAVKKAIKRKTSRQANGGQVEGVKAARLVKKRKTVNSEAKAKRKNTERETPTLKIIESASPMAAIRPQFNPTRLEIAVGGSSSKKITIMSAGVAFFMILSAAVWLFNIKYVFNVSRMPQNQSLSLEQVRTELDQTMSKLKENLALVKAAPSSLANNKNTLPLNENRHLSAAQISNLKQILTQTTVNAATSSALDNK